MVNNSSCSPYDPPKLEEKFYLVVCFGTPIAMISVVENSILLYLLITRKKLRTPSLFYIGILAFLDIVMATCYVLLLTVQVLMDFLPSDQLFEAWHTYLQLVFALSKIARTASTYFLITASIERLIVARRLSSFYVDFRRRFGAMIVTTLSAVVIQGMVYFEIEVHEYKNCTGRAKFGMGASSLVKENPLYAKIWKFWCRSLLSIFLPFVFLAVINLAVLQSLKKQISDLKFVVLSVNSRTVGKRLQAEATQNAKEAATASRLLLVLISTYLISNLLHVILTLWEFIDNDSLDSEFYVFYMFASDTVSTLSIVIAAVRLWIYFWCDPSIRREIISLPVCCFKRNFAVRTRSFFSESANDLGSRQTSGLLLNRLTEKEQMTLKDNSNIVLNDNLERLDITSHNNGILGTIANDRVTRSVNDDSILEEELDGCETIIKFISESNRTLNEEDEYYI